MSKWMNRVCLQQFNLIFFKEETLKKEVDKVQA